MAALGGKGTLRLPLYRSILIQMSQRINASSKTAVWLVRLYKLNTIAVVIGLAAFMLMFGILTGSLLAGLQFPLAVLSMAREGDGWGIWMLSPLYLSPLLLTPRWLRGFNSSS